MASLSEDEVRRLLKWASSVVDDIQDRIKALPEPLRDAGWSSLTLAMMGEMIWRSGNPEREAAHLKSSVDAALELRPAIEAKLKAMLVGENREPGHG